MKNQPQTTSIPNKPYACVSPRIGYGKIFMPPTLRRWYTMPDNDDDYDFYVLKEEACINGVYNRNEITFGTPFFKYFRIKAIVTQNRDDEAARDVRLEIDFGRWSVYQGETVTEKGDVLKMDITNLVVKYHSHKISVLILLELLYADIAHGFIKLNCEQN